MEALKGPHLVSRIQNFFGVVTNGHENHKSINQKHIITNKFWYYLFIFGSTLGDEIFYSTFIPFWFWNIDGAVGRRVVLVWTIVIYIGQGIKDIVRLPRPGHPVVKLEDKWTLEYGMPSTHAMVGISIPFSVILYTMHRYQYSVPLGIAIATTWCTIICLSRLYLGVHSVLDVLVGLALAVLLMIPVVPIVDHLDEYILTSPTAPLLLLAISILLVIYYPSSDKWTPTRGETAMIISVCVGIHVGAWLNYQTGLMTPSNLPAPYVIMWPSYTMMGYLVLRTIIGFTFVFLTRQIVKRLSYSFVCALLKQDEAALKKSENTIRNRYKTIVELSCTFLTYASIGFNILYLIPQVFRFLKIERPTFFTEI